jgi:hypothetical protein
MRCSAVGTVGRSRAQWSAMECGGVHSRSRIPRAAGGYIYDIGCVDAPGLCRRWRANKRNWGLKHMSIDSLVLLQGNRGGKKQKSCCQCLGFIYRT